MAGEVVSIALQTVRDLLTEEAKFLSGVTNQVNEVQAELIRMQCFLKDADKRQKREEIVRNYVREIRGLAYRIENVLDTFAIEVESRREGHGFKKFLQRLAFMSGEAMALHKVGSEIANIKEKIRSLTTSLQTYGITGSEKGQSSNATLDQNQQSSRETYPHQVEEYFVGMEDHIEKLVSLITDENRSHRVISIYGMGGLGKTTLVRKIYNHVDVQRGFKEFAWVSVTQQYSRRTLLQDILLQLLPDEKKKNVDERKRVEKMTERELVGELYTMQKETSCLVVLDDMWKIEDWTYLNPAFPYAEANSKILITTRNQKLAEVEFPYPLNPLSEDDGWKLLQKKAFAKREAKDSEKDPKLEAVGREIVLKCGRLPLAIAVIGGVLSQNNSINEWVTVKEDVESYLRMSGGSNEGYGAVLQVLALSYDELPYHLKPCFLYLGHFREDEDINAEMLYLMWIAEGMISSDHRGAQETLTDVAERYLYELASRSMVLVKWDEFSGDRRAESCYLHDLMRDFCLARGKEVEFVKSLDFRGGKDPLSDSSTDDHFTPPRCSIHVEYTERHGLNDCDATTNMALKAQGQLRSLLISSTWRLEVSFPQVICDSNKFKYLRVLKFENYYFKDGRLPGGIKKLILLRFLSLEGCRFKKLPSSIGQLQYLETLDTRHVAGVKNFCIEVPNVLWKLKRLRHLYFGFNHRSRVKGKLRFFGMSKLETLIGFHNDEHDFKDVSELNNLRRLDATVCVSQKTDISEVLSYLIFKRHKLREARFNIFYISTSASLKKEDKIVPCKEFFTCHCLHGLSIFHGKFEFQKVELPPLFSSNLNELELRMCPVEGDPMVILGKLPNLRRLILADVDLLDKKVMICDANAFPKLISLKIISLLKLEKWEVAQGSMPNLSYLALEDCNNLEMIPDGLRFITTLKKFEIFGFQEFNILRRQVFNIRRLLGIDSRRGVDYDKNPIK